ncbi:hypothetical protein JBW_02167 [Pelosinus fermentans JBW45]|uniref:Uncharacterized protein n=1 Tax=Pelosinus fermentans JBW45 TaxID=1192197 RepID=I9NUL8_9FIRM|nr:hypothetical protein JBW_02167 [Pelosinus fermentans JBW45]
MEEQPIYLILGGILFVVAVYAYIKYDFFKVKE